MKLAFRVLVASALLAGCASSPEDVGTNESRVTVCGQTTIKGIDVYHGDNNGSPIPWNKVKSAGMSFAFCKATEGTTFVDSSFATNWAGMKSAGLVRGAYHFFHADLDPTTQANFFLSTVGAVGPGDMLVLDMETTNNQTEATIVAHALTFLQTVETKTGIKPLLYTSPLFLSSFGGLGAYPLWVANYGVSCPDVPSAWKTYTFWQSTSTGSLSFITGALDMDSFNGSLAQLEAFAGMNASDGGAGDASAPDAAADAAADAASDAAPISDAATGGDAADGGGPSSSVGGCDAGGPPRGSELGAIALIGLAALALRRSGASAKAPRARRTRRARKSSRGRSKRH